MFAASEETWKRVTRVVYIVLKIAGTLSPLWIFLALWNLKKEDPFTMAMLASMQVALIVIFIATARKSP